MREDPPDFSQQFRHAGCSVRVQIADNAAANDASPVGVVREVHGHCTVKHTDGTTEAIIVGTPVHEGDVIELEIDGLGRQRQVVGQA